MISASNYKAKPHALSTGMFLFLIVLLKSCSEKMLSQRTRCAMREGFSDCACWSRHEVAVLDQMIERDVSIMLTGFYHAPELVPLWCQYVQYMDKEQPC